MRSVPAFVLLFAACAGSSAAEPAPAAQPAAPADGDLYQSAKDLFDQYAPADVKAQYDFPTKQDFETFLARLQQALAEGRLEDLPAYEDQARAVLAILRTQPEYADYADWLAARLEEIDESRHIAEAGPSAPTPSGPSAPANAAPAIPFYSQWYQRMQARAAPANAAELMPRLQKAFADEGVPPELAWLAEVESSLNPSARSPSGARGLFQLKASTAKGLGLSTFLPDERTDPDKSAHAAARQLRALREKFGSWPLAIAAYNAGEGRVGRALNARHAHDYAGIAEALSAETRMYVPEVCAVIAVRTGMKPGEIPPPRG